MDYYSNNDELCPHISFNFHIILTSDQPPSKHPYCHLISVTYKDKKD
jgi:hypothetical protein